MPEKIFLGGEKGETPPLSRETTHGLERLGAFAKYTGLKVELANDGLPSQKRIELLQQLNKEEEKLIEQGLIPPDREHHALIRAMSDEELDVSIDYLDSLDPNPRPNETRLQALERMKSKNPITEEQKSVRTLLEREKTEREFIRAQVREQTDVMGQVRERPVSDETPQEEWVTINHLKNPQNLRKAYEAAMGGESTATKAVEQAIREHAHAEATKYWKLHQESIAERFRSEDDGGISKMAQQVVEGIPINEEPVQNLGMVLFLTFRAMRGTNEERAAQLTGETIAHGHLKGIKRTTMEKPEMDAVLRAARDHASNLRNPQMLDRYGLGSAKRLYQSVQHCVETA